MKYFCKFCILILIFSSCKKEDVNDVSEHMYYSYFPLVKQSWRIYDVDSIAHREDDDGTNQPDTSIGVFHFKIMEVIDSAFIDGEGTQAFKVARYRKMNDTLPWDFEAEWVSKLTSNSAQRVENNVRYIRLAFPVSTKTESWNGNAYNTFQDEDYSYTDIHVPATINNLSFDSTVTVLQLEDNNVLHRIFKQEKYANHVGMIYKQKDSLNLNGILQITNGFEYKETLQSYGN
jgi:hypothetical protein